MANPTTNFGWVMPASTDLVTDLPADFAVFGDAVDSSLSTRGGYSTTATAAGTTTMTVSSNRTQFFTGSTTQTVVMPVASTLTLGWQQRIVNNSSGVVTVQSSGANTIYAVPAGGDVIFTCILASGTTAASWDYKNYIASATFAGASVYKAAGQAITAYTDTALAFDTENYDSDGFHDNVTNNSRFTIPTGKTGKYQVSINISLTPAGDIGLFLYKNGSAVTLGTNAGQMNRVANVGVQLTLSSTFELALSATDYVEVFINCGAGGITTVKQVASISYLGA